MTAATVAVIGLLLFAWAVVSGALARHNVTGPLAFTAAGYLLGNGDWGVVAVDVDTSVIHLVAEATLALVLFSDAARINSQKLRHDLGLPVRLLAIGLPLSILGGLGLASVLFGGLPVGLALLVGAALAPTDAALSASVIEDERVPLRLRRALNVESGLNDGIATPVVSVALAAAIGAVAGGSTESYDIQAALREIGSGGLLGAAIGIGGAAALNATARRGWIGASGRYLAAFGLAVTAFAAALAVDGNGFIAAFVAGLAYGAVVDRGRTDLDRSDELPELGGELMGLVVWFLFGAALVPLAIEAADPTMVVYALLSLTVVRMVPVALSLWGSGLDAAGVAFVAWFGPRGLASVVFAVLAVEELEGVVDGSDRAVGAIVLTVLSSVVLHGVTARPGGRAYARREAEPGRDPVAPRARRRWFHADAR
ncbi:MAG: cation:proton antiporter [Acidimicrobiales bacterium]|nr:cation:proton antiporter [Acidimicrobiales bacterium]MCB1016590.1 cation:proton antiporter [Acidimicrobiales bacterium]